MQFTKATVTLSCAAQDGSPKPFARVEALTLNHFAIHKAVGDADENLKPLNVGGYYVLTHVPTGLKLADAYKQSSLKRLVAQLDALKLDWNFTGLWLPAEIREKAAPIIRAFNADSSN
jgi:hypothetical protein